jgi:hypothetical protein
MTLASVANPLNLYTTTTVSPQARERRRFGQMAGVQRVFGCSSGLYLFVGGGPIREQSGCGAMRANVSENMRSNMIAGLAKLVELVKKAVAAAALLESHTYSNQALTVTGDDALTYDQIAQILSAELGRPIRYAQPGAIRYALHARRRLVMPWGMVFVTLAIYTTARLGVAAGLTQSVRDVLGRDPISFAQFAHRERGLWTPQSDLGHLPR